MRLTNKEHQLIIDTTVNIDYQLTVVAEKLGQLEDIEEELGIDLITLFKALKKGIYIKKQSQTEYPLALLRRHYSNHTTRYYVFDNGKEKEIKLKAYGKTWALTKEELGIKEKLC